MPIPISPAKPAVASLASSHNLSQKKGSAEEACACFASRLAQEKKIENEKSKMRQYHNELQGRRVVHDAATAAVNRGASPEAAASQPCDPPK